MKFRSPVRRWFALIVALALTLNIGTLSAAQASATTPTWYDQARSALFIHWGMTNGVAVSPMTACDTDPATVPYLTGAEFDSAASAAGWSPDDWVAGAEAIGASYIVFATFHSQLGYLRSWPSAIPGSPTTSTDYLQELIDAASDRGIKVVVYITPDPSKNGEGGCDWLDESAYQAYKGSAVDLTTAGGWAQYSYDVVAELIDTHPGISGLWFDGWNPGWSDLGMMSMVRSLRADLVVFANDPASAPRWGEDVQAVEDNGKVAVPRYDSTGASWLPAGGSPEFVTAPLDWMYTGWDATVDARQIARQFAVTVGSGWRYNLGLPSLLDGSFTGGASSLLTDLAGYLAWADPAVHGTTEAGYAAGIPFAGAQGNAWMSSTQSSDGQTQYLHVMRPPSPAVSEWNGSDFVTDPSLAPHDRAITTVTTDSAGATWLIDGDRVLWRKSGGTWSIVPGGAQDIATGIDGDVYVIGLPDGSANGHVKRWNGSGWDLMPGGGIRVAVGPGGHPWLVNSYGEIYRFDGAAFVQVPGEAQDISGMGDGSVYIIGEPYGSANGLLKYWNGSSWSLASGGGFRVAADGTGGTWMTNTYGEVWYFDGTSIAIKSGPGLAADVSAGVDGSVWRMPPVPSSLTVPDAGYDVSGVSDLRAGDPLAFTQSGGVLTVNGIDWADVSDFGSVILALSVTPSSRILSSSGSTATASSAYTDPSRPASAVLDDDYGTYWAPAYGATSSSVTVQRSTASTVSGLRVVQYDLSPTTTGGYEAPPPERIRAATISVSTDGVSFTEVWSGELLNRRGAQYIDIPDTAATYFRLAITSNWGGGSSVKISGLEFVAP